ncbi:MAG TPA: DUF2242 domain-containing protein [Steroidobacteraceae bacterium]|jgi:hypothetical protein|nr:DUF2242 domain-containing protein [Steroidobacteraceae bacterium]
MSNRQTKASGPMWAVAAATALLVGCAHQPPPKQFTADAPFSRNFSGTGDSVCWSVKRALLSQGYMLDRPNDSGVMTGSRDQQPTPKLNVTTRLQTTCADNKNGTSSVFVTATREENKLQKMSQTTSMGVGPATLTLPSGSAKVLGTVRRETITDPNFYGQFFSLVQNFVDQEKLSQASAPAVAHPAEPLPSASPPAARNDVQPNN